MVCFFSLLDFFRNYIRLIILLISFVFCFRNFKCDSHLLCPAQFPGCILFLKIFYNVFFYKGRGYRVGHISYHTLKAIIPPVSLIGFGGIRSLTNKVPQVYLISFSGRGKYNKVFSLPGDIPFPDIFPDMEPVQASFFHGGVFLKWRRDRDSNSETLAGGSFPGYWSTINLSLLIWWSWTGSNRRPSDCQPDALPTELQPPVLIIQILFVV